MGRRRADPARLVVAAVAAALAGGAGSVSVEGWPERPVRIVVPLAPGGGNDTVARMVGQKLAERLGQSFIVDNRPGAGGVIASELVAHAPADGHTLYLLSTSFTAAPALRRKLPFDPLHDFLPVTRLATIPGALTVHASMPVRTVQDLIALARARPGEVTYGSAGIGSGSHFGGELFKLAAGANLLHVPFKGSALVTHALLAGDVMVSFSNPVSALPHVRGRRLRVLMVTSATRWPLLPQFPGAAEAGVKDYEQLVWNGVAVPARTPAPVVARLHGELARIMHDQDVVERLARNGSRPHPEKPEEFARFIDQEIVRWRTVVAASGIRPN